MTVGYPSSSMASNQFSTSHAAHQQTIADGDFHALYPTRDFLGGDEIAGHSSKLAGQERRHLRRKTPSGTLDAGYDLSGRLEPGEPPTKHFAADGIGFNGVNGYPSPFRDPDSSFAPSEVGSWSMGNLPINPSVAALQAPWATWTDSYGLGLAIQSPYQPVWRTQEVNVRAFCPPPPYYAFGMGRLNFASGVFASSCGNTGSSKEIQGYILQHPDDRQSNDSIVRTTPPQTFSWGPYLGSHPSTLTPEPYSFGSTIATEGQYHFKDKALALGHSKYNTLLTYLQPGKLHGLRDDQRRAFRHMSFPKPPRSKRLSDSESSVAMEYTIDSAAMRNSSGRLSSVPAQKGSVRDASSWESNSSVSQLQLPPQNDTLLADILSGIQNSTNILNNLCEQASWTWLEGMLLLGCLHYAVERFDIALLWFSRILTIDSR